MMRSRRDIIAVGAGITAALVAKEIISPIRAEASTLSTTLKSIIDYCGGVAVNDGSSSHASLLKSAVESAATDQVQLYFPEGTYNFNGVSITTSYINWLGASNQTTVIKNHPTLIVDNFIHLESLKFEYSNTTVGNFIYPNGDINILFIGSCNFYNMKKVIHHNTSLSVPKVFNVRIINNTFTGFSSSTSSVSIINLSTSEVNNVIITHNLIDDIECTDYSAGVFLFFIGDATAVDTSANIIISENIIRNVRPFTNIHCYGILVRAMIVTISNNQVSDIDNNVPNDGRGHGIYVKGKMVIISNNIVHNTNLGQISIKGYSTENQIIGNTCTGYCKSAVSIRLWGEGVINDNYLNLNDCDGGISYFINTTAEGSMNYYDQAIIQNNRIHLENCSVNAIKINGGKLVHVSNNVIESDSICISVAQDMEHNKAVEKIIISNNFITAVNSGDSAIYFGGEAEADRCKAMFITNNRITTRNNLVLRAIEELIFDNNDLDFHYAQTATSLISAYIGDGSANRPHSAFSHNRFVFYGAVYTGLHVINNGTDSSFNLINNTFIERFDSGFNPIMNRCLRVENGGYKDFIIKNNDFSTPASFSIQHYHSNGINNFDRVVIDGNSSNSSYLIAVHSDTTATIANIDNNLLVDPLNIYSNSNRYL